VARGLAQGAVLVVQPLGAQLVQAAEELFSRLVLTPNVQQLGPAPRMGFTPCSLSLVVRAEVAVQPQLSATGMEAGVVAAQF
jgi:hypothetical protein